VLGEAFGGVFDAAANTQIGSATAEVTRHGGINVVIGRAGVLGDQGGGRHDLTRLAVAALRHIGGNPRFANGRGGFTFVALDGGDRGIVKLVVRQLAGAHGDAVQVHRAGTALADAATILGAGHLEVVAEHPEQRGAFRCIDRDILTVNFESGRHDIDQLRLRIN